MFDFRSTGAVDNRGICAKLERQFKRIRPQPRTPTDSSAAAAAPVASSAMEAAAVSAAAAAYVEHPEGQRVRS